jgi:hypothetical protein
LFHGSPEYQQKERVFSQAVEGISSIPACCLATHLIGNLGATGGDGAVFLALIHLIAGKDSW